MSKVIFSAQNGTFYMPGRERRWFAWQTSKLFAMSVGLKEMDNDIQQQIFDKHFPDYVSTLDAADTHLHVGNGDLCGYDLFTLQLNTAYAIGGDAMKLAARIHGQCEIHGYVMPDSFDWLESVLIRGVRDGFFAKSTVFPLVDFMTRAVGPIVMSYSVCDGFPNQGVADFSGTSDEWEELSDDERWRLAFEQIQAKPSLEICQEGWEEFRFGHGMNGFHLNKLWADEILGSNT